MMHHTTAISGIEIQLRKRGAAPFLWYLLVCLFHVQLERILFQKDSRRISLEMLKTCVLVQEKAYSDLGMSKEAAAAGGKGKALESACAFNQEKVYSELGMSDEAVADEWDRKSYKYYPV